jgi:transcriptional regulator with XRE-family HTH domain
MRYNSSIKAVRELLKLTQEKAVARAKEKGETIGRDEWVKVETGTNKASTARIQKALAAGLDLDVATIEGLLTGKIEPSEADDKDGERGDTGTRRHGQPLHRLRTTDVHGEKMSRTAEHSGNRGDF